MKSVLITFLLSSAALMAQNGTTIPSGSDLPSTCTYNDAFVQVTTIGRILYQCKDQSQWVRVGVEPTTYIAPATYGAALKADLGLSVSKKIRISVWGDSLSRCTVSNCGVGPNFPSDNNIWPTLMRTYFNSRYKSHGSGLIPIRSTMNTTGSEFDPIYFSAATGVIGTCNVGFQQLAPGIPGFQCYQMGDGAATLTGKSIQFDSIGEYYLTNFGLTGAGYTVSIDGANQGTFGQQNTGCCIGQHTYVPAPTGLGSHTFSITNPGAGNTFLFYVDAAIGTTGVSVDNIAMGAAKSEYFSANNNEGAIGPINNTDLLFTEYATTDTWFMVMLTTNDFLNVPTADTNWYLNGMLSDLISIRGVSPSKILLILPPMASPQNAGGTGTYDQLWYTKQVKNSAETWGTAFLDLSNTDRRFQTFQTQFNASFMETDGTHLNNAGQAALWTAIKTALGL